MPEVDEIDISFGFDIESRQGESAIEDEKQTGGGSGDLRINRFVVLAQLVAIRDQHDGPTSPRIECARPKALTRPAELPDLGGEHGRRGKIGEELVDGVNGDIRFGMERTPNGKIDIHAVHQGLVELTPRPEAEMLICAPGPHGGIGIAGTKRRRQTCTAVPIHRGPTGPRSKFISLDGIRTGARTRTR